MTAYAKVGGIWKPSSSSPLVRVGGIWKPLSQGYARVAGVWRPFLGPTLTFIDVAVVAGQGTTIGYGNFVVPKDGLLLVAAHAFATNNRTANTFTIGSTTVTPSARNTTAATQKWATGCLAVTAGTYAISLNLSGSNGTSSRNACAAWLLTNYQSATAVDGKYNYVSNVNSLGLTMNLGASGVAVYLAGEGVRGSATWSGATQDGIKTATVDGFAQTFIAASKKTPVAATGDVETATWGSTSNGNYIVGGAWH